MWCLFDRVLERKKWCLEREVSKSEVGWRVGEQEKNCSEERP